MKKWFLKVAIFLMILQGGHTEGHHDHVHYEIPEWKVLAESAIHSSGTTSNVYFYYSP